MHLCLSVYVCAYDCPSQILSAIHTIDFTLSMLRTKGSAIVKANGPREHCKQAYSSSQRAASSTSDGQAIDPLQTDTYSATCSERTCPRQCCKQQNFEPSNLSVPTRHVHQTAMRALHQFKQVNKFKQQEKVLSQWKVECMQRMFKYYDIKNTLYLHLNQYDALDERLQNMNPAEYDQVIKIMI